MKRVLIIGSVPETAGIGGVTIHISRLILALKKDSLSMNIEPILCDYKKLFLWKQIYLIAKYKIVHIHASNPILRLFYVILAKLFCSKSILTIHGNLGRFGIFKNYLDYLSIKYCDIPILINQGSYELALKWNAKATFISAFIPPQEEDPIPENVYSWIRQEKDKGHKLFATCAYKRVFTNDGKELYSIEFLVNYFKQHSDRSLIISDPSGDYMDFYKFNPSDNIFIISYPHSFYSLIKEIDVVIRATATDGDSLAVKEALSLAKPVIATDCVSRHPNVLLFHYGDYGSFDNICEKVFSEYQLTNLNEVDTVSKIIELYIN